MEADENTCRESFKPSEAAKMARLIEEAERPKAAARKEASRAKPGQQIGSENFSAPTKGSPEGGETKTIAARAVGMSRPTLEKAQAVVEAAEAEPEKYADIAKRMDNTGKVDPAHKELLRRQNEAEKSEPESKPVEPKEASRHEPRGVGLDWAHKAIAMLQQIPSKDGLRKEALELVVRWCKHNAKEST